MGLFPQTGRFLPRIRCRAALASRSVCGEDRGRDPVPCLSTGNLAGGYIRRWGRAHSPQMEPVVTLRYNLMFVMVLPPRHATDVGM